MEAPYFDLQKKESIQEAYLLSEAKIRKAKMLEMHSKSKSISWEVEGEKVY